MISVEVDDDGVDCADLAGVVERGETVLFTRDGVPVAIMRPVDQNPGAATKTAVPADVAPLTRDAPPEVIRQHLLDECRPTFDAQHEQMSDEQKASERWHERMLAIALLQSDRTKFWRLAHAMARREWPDMPEDVPDHVVRRIAGL